MRQDNKVQNVNGLFNGLLIYGRAEDGVFLYETRTTGNTKMWTHCGRTVNKSVGRYKYLHILTCVVADERTGDDPHSTCCV